MHRTIKTYATPVSPNLCGAENISLNMGQIKTLLPLNFLPAGTITSFTVLYAAVVLGIHLTVPYQHLLQITGWQNCSLLLGLLLLTLFHYYT